MLNKFSAFSLCSSFSSTILDSFKLYDREPEEMVTEGDIEAMYAVRRSFTDRLPWVEYLKEHQCFLLDDETSVAAVYDLVPTNAEGVTLGELARTRDNFTNFLNNVFPGHDNNPWVVEFYQSDVLSLSNFTQTIREYAEGLGPDNPLRKEYLPVIEKHLVDVCKAGGLFKDDTVTGTNWRGAIRMYRMIFYRRYGKKGKPPRGRTPIDELKETCQKVESQLAQSGVKAIRVKGKQFYEWMFRWFNPKPAATNGDTEALLKRLPYVDDDDLPYGHDFAESLLHTPPVSDNETGSWYFDGIPHKLISVQNLRQSPKVGALSAPKKVGNNVVSLFDKMPEGSIMSMKVIITPSEMVEAKLDKIEEKAKGNNPKINKMKRDVSEAKERIAENNNMFPVELAFYVRGDDEESLRQNQVDVISLLQVEGLNAIDNEDDPIGLDSYLVNLPMNYDPSKEKKRRRSRLLFTQHIANLAPISGRGKGTGNPGLMFFNRGGEPMCFDPLNPFDRSKNAHMCFFGPTGSGKSAQLVGMLLWTMAVYNARVFVVEAGNSFGMLREYMKEVGVSTHEVSMKSGRDTIIPPFANALKALEIEEAEIALYSTDALEGLKGKEEPKVQVEPEKIFNDAQMSDGEEYTEEYTKDFLKKVTDPAGEIFKKFEKGIPLESSDDEEYTKDYLGEMEIAASIMVSGGDANIAKGIRLGDKQLIRECILQSAKKCRDQGLTMPIPADVAEELLIIANKENVPPNVRERFFEYAAAMRMFTQGLTGQIFNRPGQLWPECDFTHIDLAEFVKDNRKAELAVSYMSILNNVNDIAERDQMSGRPIIFLTDEAHLITKNPLLAPAVVKIVKMWRKLNAWLILATQNMKDFPDEAEVMLSLFEWWICLALEPNEVEEVARFKKLSEEQKHLLGSAKKQKNCYTEGVVLSSKLAELFRAVPPSLALAFAMSEGDEKAERQKIMDEYNITEVEAAKYVAKNIDKLRGIKPADAT